MLPVLVCRSQFARGPLRIALPALPATVCAGLTARGDLAFAEDPEDLAAAGPGTASLDRVALLSFPLPPLQGRVLLRPPKPQRHVGGGQPGGAGFLAGFCPAPPKIHRNLQIQWISVKFPEIPAKF